MTSLRYPLGTQDFPTLRECGMAYVDKTELIYRLVNRYRMVFLSRPRRFGKSLLLSTIQAYFEGRKDLFQGLKIEELEKDWETYPVIHLSLASFDASNNQSLDDMLDIRFKQIEEKLGISDVSQTPGARFYAIITETFRKKKLSSSSTNMTIPS